MAVVEWPSAVGEPSVFHEGDGFGEALVWCDVRVAEIVQASEDVVMPVGWEGEAGPIVMSLSVFDHFAG